MSVEWLKQAIQSRLGERGGIVHSVGTLVGGTAFAQGVAILALPLLTRLYTPAEFSVLAVYASVLGILTVVACLRFEIAIPLPERDEDAASLLVLAIMSVIALSLAVALSIIFFRAEIVGLLRFPPIAPYLWMMPVGILLGGAYAAAQFWATRRKHFSRIARTRMLQSMGGVGIQVSAGAIGGGPVGLLLGHLISIGAGFVGLARDAWRHDREIISAVSLGSIRRAFAENSRYPTYSALEALANTAGMQLPVIFIAAVAVGPEAGFMLLATRVIAAPFSLVGGAMSQVYMAHAPHEIRAGHLGDFTARTLSGLVKTGIGPLIFTGIVAGPLSATIFGEEWSRVGEIVAWLTPMFILQFLSVPVSMVMHIKSRQRMMMMIQLIGLVVRVGAVWIAFVVNPFSLVKSYAFSGALFYGFCCFSYYAVAEVKLAQAVSAVRKSLPILMAWIVIGWVVRVIASTF